jgi:endonuclease/exonuclease/phosphatase family metal-dependent hydrolase
LRIRRISIILTFCFLLTLAYTLPTLAGKPPKDTTPPAVTITSPTDGAVVSGMVTISFTATDENPVVEYEILVDGLLRVAAQNYDWDTTQETNTAHSITCRARDNSKNWGEASITVTVDNGGQNSAPVVTITNPTGGSTVSDTVTVTVTVDDEDSLVPDVYIDDVYTTTASSFDWDTTSYSDGPHTIFSEVTDTGGLTGSDTVSVTVDNSGSSEPTDAAFKVMSYNIEASGENADWKQVVKEENPDILILVETGTWDDGEDYVLNTVVDEFNAYFVDEVPYVGYCAQDITYSTSGEAILSRYPVVEFNQLPLVPLDDESDYDVTHDFIEAVIDIDGTYIHVFGSHLKAMSGTENEWRRERETEGIINYMDNLGDVPIMYMGDLNSFSPDDTGDLAPLGDLGYGPMTMKLYPSDPTYGQYASSVHTFTDVFRTLNPTDPGYSYGHQSPEYTSRIDFIVVNSFFADKLINSTCGDTPTADTGSDHYSVDVFIQWNSTTEPDTTPPGQVTGLTAQTVSMSQIDLSWNANTENDLSHYRVYRDGALIAQSYQTIYSDTGLQPGTTYTYEVSARDTSLNEGPKSDPASATTNQGGSSDLIVLNEFLPDPYSLYSEEWIELYNPQELEADLSGYILDDLIGGGTNPYTIPDGTVISGYGFLVFYQGATGIGLNNDGDDVNLIQPDGSTVQDSYSYSSSADDLSYGRESDGSLTWTTFDSPTPGETNGGTSSPGDSVVLNEFLPDPYSLYSEEWIELYNPLTVEVDISGYVLDDITDGGTGSYTIPFGTTISASGFLVFYQSATGIALNNDGDTVNYLKPDGTTVLDSYTYASSSDDVSYGRENDGGTVWTTFTSPTPGESNGGTSSPAESILINEFLPDPYSLYSEEWIELYNPLDVEVDLSDYVLDDIVGGGTGSYTIPTGTTIPALGFVVFYQSTTGIALNNDGDTVNFLKPDGTTVLDSYIYSSSTDDVSYGRETDGSDTWTTFSSPTPGSSNTGQSPPPTQVHVQSISFSTHYSSNGRTEYLDITVEVVNTSGNPAEGVTVTGQFITPDGTFEYSGQTDGSGLVTFIYSTKPNKPLSSGDYTFTVGNLSGTGYEYDPSSNIETSDSWTKA